MNEEYEYPADKINGGLNYEIIYWEQTLDRWTNWGYATTDKGAEVKRLRAKSQGCLHVRVFKITEVTPLE